MLILLRFSQPSLGIYEGGLNIRSRNVRVFNFALFDHELCREVLKVTMFQTSDIFFASFRHVLSFFNLPLELFSN